MAHLEIIPHQSSGDAAAAHAIANIAMESEGESRPLKIHLPYRDVHISAMMDWKLESCPRCYGRCYRS
jgi:hypothetical protein